MLARRRADDRRIGLPASSMPSVRELVRVVRAADRHVPAEVAAIDELRVERQLDAGVLHASRGSRVTLLADAPADGAMLSSIERVLASACCST